MSRFAERLVAVAVAVALGVLVPAAPAFAHAVLVGSDPPNGSTVAVAPGRVVLRFSEDISARFSSARLLDGSGRTVTGTRIDPAGSGPRQLALALPPLSGATYGVAWRVLAEDDGHTTSGVVVFTVGTAAPSPGGRALEALDTGGGLAPFDVARRWLGLCLLAGLIGGLAFVALVLRRRSADGFGAARHRVLSMASGCGAVAAVIGLADPLAQAGRTGPSAVASVLGETRWGELWLSREAAVVVLAVLAYALRTRAADRLDRARWITAGLLAALVVTFDGLSGHAASVESGRVAAVAAVAVHALTGYVWLGGLVALVVTAAAPGGMALIRSVRTRFGTLAAGSVGLAVATGMYSAGGEVGSVAAVTGTTYGRVLLVKVALVLAVGCLGLVNATRLRGGPALRTRGRWVLPAEFTAPEKNGRTLDSSGPVEPPARKLRGFALLAGPASRNLRGFALLAGPPSRQLLAAEALAGAVLLLAVGVLVETPPSRVDSRPPSAPVGVMDSGAAEDIVVSVQVTPDRPGRNGITVVAVSGRRPPPAPIDAVSLALDGAGPVALTEIEPGRYFGTADLAAGPVRATVDVQRAGRRLTVPVAWPVHPPTPPPAEPANDLAPITNLAALLLLCAFAALGARGVALRRRRAAPADDIPERILPAAVGAADGNLEDVR